MSFTEYVMRSGSFEVRLLDQTPRALLRDIDVAKVGFSLLVVLPTRVEAEAWSDAALLAAARYVGVYRRQDEGGLRLGGAGLGILLGDEDGKGDIFENPKSTRNGYLTQWHPTLTPMGLTPGTLTSPGGVWPEPFRFVTARQAWDLLCPHFGVEWRVTTSLTLDVGPVGVLYGATPRLVILGTSAGLAGGRDLGLTGVLGDASRSTDLEDYTAKAVVMWDEGSGADTVTKYVIAGGDAPVFKRPSGHPLIMDRPIQGDDRDGAPTTATARAHLNLYSSPRREWDVTGSGSYDLGTEAPVGSPVYLYDPASGLYDPAAATVAYRGSHLWPVTSRLMGLTTPIREGYGVYLRTRLGPAQDPIWRDLTPYLVPETGPQRVVLDSIPRASR